MPVMEAVTQITVMCWDGSKPVRRRPRLGQGLAGGDSALLGSLDKMRMKVLKATIWLVHL